MQFRKFFTKQLGFTMVELLVVIAIIGILATAVLAALNPAEQLKKGRDTSRKADATTILNAADRYQASYGCYPWYWATATSTCAAASQVASFTPATGKAVVAADFNTAGNVLALVKSSNELNAQFASRSTITNSEMWLSETNSQVAVCFEPESKSARGGSMGTTKNNLNTAASTTCANAYAGGVTTAGGKTCDVCVPQ